MKENETNSLKNTTLLTPNLMQQWQHTPNNHHLINGYHRQGSATAPRVHLLHGTGFSSMTLAALGSHLPVNWNLWLTDVPGHGLSEQPSHKMPDWQKLAKNIGYALEKETDVANNGPLIGVGHSMGGVVTLMAAVQYPHLFNKIILLDPVLFQTELIIAQYLMRKTGVWKKSALVKSVSNRTETWPNLEEMIAELTTKQLYKCWQPEVLAQFAQYSTKTNKDGSLSLCCSPRWEGSFFGSYPKGLWNAVRNVNIPVEILIAKKSYSFIPRSAKRAANINKKIQWQMFGERHCFPMEQPIETAKKITQLINE